MHTQSFVPMVAPRLSLKPVANRRAFTDDDDSQAARLARLLIAPNLTAASELIDQFLASGATPTALFTRLFEPAAYSLGDLWDDDSCSEFEVTIGLCHLQTAMRRISFNCLSAPPAKAAPRNVLIVPQPGEPHMLCAALDSELLWQAGWNTHCEFPASDKALQDLVATNRFDALDLSLSPSLRRGHWLPRVAETISKVCRASRNPGIVIVVGGRMFEDRPEAAAQVGADAARTTALDIEQVILDALHRRNPARRQANSALM
jgi:methanogenic corrinoid protein MtbC1